MDWIRATGAVSDHRDKKGRLMEVSSGLPWVGNGPFQNIALGDPGTLGQHQRGIQRLPEPMFDLTGTRTHHSKSTSVFHFLVG